MTTLTSAPKPLTAAMITRGFRFRPASYPTEANYTVLEADYANDFYVAQYTQRGLPVAVGGYTGTISSIVSGIEDGTLVKMRRHSWIG